MPRKSPRQTIEIYESAPLPKSGNTNADKAVSACSEWFARHNEQEVLAKRWQRLETHLIRQHRWFQLSSQERAVHPEAPDLEAISDQLDELYLLNLKLLISLPSIAATTGHGLASKLSVALVLIHPEENKEVHTLIQSVLMDVKAN
tara:strand:+ start:722 stop:1159 length:438 start_codon:yes stop_codon:yes gene_type:complete